MTNSGAYTVNPDCTGMISTTLGQLNLAVDFVIVDSGKEIYFIISSNPASLVAYEIFSEPRVVEMALNLDP
jgi:hypothetical protein